MTRALFVFLLCDRKHFRKLISDPYHPDSRKIQADFGLLDPGVTFKVCFSSIRYHEDTYIYL